MTIRYADMFAGIGGFPLGLRQAFGEENIRFAYGCDCDKHAAATYLANFGHNVLGDIAGLDMSSLPDCDIVFGGFPCQPFSRNGKHYNSGRIKKDDKESLKIQDAEETRDELYLHLVKLLRTKQPPRFLFENVKGLQTIMDESGDSYYDTIKRAFEGAGYSVHTKVLDTADFGLPQQRKRLFFVGFRNDLSARLGIRSFSWPDPIPRTSCIANILERGVPSKYLLSNLWRRRICRKLKDDSGKPKVRLTALQDAYDETIVPEMGKVVPLAIIYGDTPSGGPRQMDKLYSIAGISPTIATFSTPAIDAPSGWRILTPRECARLQGFPDSFRLPSTDAQAYKQVGNAVSVATVAAIVRKMF
jgi:DNA (cytosine-5)-methyltransferase 1